MGWHGNSIGKSKYSWRSGRQVGKERFIEKIRLEENKTKDNRGTVNDCNLIESKS